MRNKDPTKIFTHYLVILIIIMMMLMITDNVCWGFPGGANGKEPTCQCWRPERWGFHPRVGKIPWRRVWQLTPVFLSGEFQGHRSQQVMVNRVPKSWKGLKQFSIQAQNALADRFWGLPEFHSRVTVWNVRSGVMTLRVGLICNCDLS